MPVSHIITAITMSIPSGDLRLTVVKMATTAIPKPLIDETTVLTKVEHTCEYFKDHVTDVSKPFKPFFRNHSIEGLVAMTMGTLTPAGKAILSTRLEDLYVRFPGAVDELARQSRDTHDSRRVPVVVVASAIHSIPVGQLRLFARARWSWILRPFC